MSKVDMISHKALTQGLFFPIICPMLEVVDTINYTDNHLAPHNRKGIPLHKSLLPVHKPIRTQLFSMCVCVCVCVSVCFFGMHDVEIRHGCAPPPPPPFQYVYVCVMCVLCVWCVCVFCFFRMHVGEITMPPPARPPPRRQPLPPKNTIHHPPHKKSISMKIHIPYSYWQKKFWLKKKTP